MVTWSTVCDGSFHSLASSFDGTTRSISYEGAQIASDTPAGTHANRYDTLCIGGENFGRGHGYALLWVPSATSVCGMWPRRRLNHRSVGLLSAPLCRPSLGPTSNPCTQVLHCVSQPAADTEGAENLCCSVQPWCSHENCVSDRGRVYGSCPLTAPSHSPLCVCGGYLSLYALYELPPPAAVSHVELATPL
jgi:hypothetical protein